MLHIRKATVSFVIASVFLLISVGLCFSAEKSAAKPTLKFRLGNVVQPTHPMNVAAEKFAKKVSDRSSGRIKITIFPARQQIGRAHV